MPDVGNGPACGMKQGPRLLLLILTLPFKLSYTAG